MNQLHEISQSLNHNPMPKIGNVQINTTVITKDSMPLFIGKPCVATSHTSTGKVAREADLGPISFLQSIHAVVLERDKWKGSFFA